MEPASKAERARAEFRAGNLQPTRVARKATIDSRRKLLADFVFWLWETQGIQLTVLLTEKPPDPEELCRLLVANVPGRKGLWKVCRDN